MPDLVRREYPEKPYAEGWRAEVLGSILLVELVYPRAGGGRPTSIEVGMESVRAADSIRVHFDHQRNGWAVLQASRFGWDGDDEICDADWQEVAFIPAWGRKEERTDGTR